MTDEMDQALLDCALHEDLTPMRWPSETDRSHGAWVEGYPHRVGFSAGQVRPPGGRGVIFTCASHPPLSSL